MQLREFAPVQLLAMLLQDSRIELLYRGFAGKGCQEASGQIGGVPIAAVEPAEQAVGVNRHDLIRPRVCGYDSTASGPRCVGSRWDEPAQQRALKDEMTFSQ